MGFEHPLRLNRDPDEGGWKLDCECWCTLDTIESAFDGIFAVCRCSACGGFWVESVRSSVHAGEGRWITETDIHGDLTWHFFAMMPLTDLEAASLRQVIAQASGLDKKGDGKPMMDFFMANPVRSVFFFEVRDDQNRPPHEAVSGVGLWPDVECDGSDYWLLDSAEVLGPARENSVDYVEFSASLKKFFGV